MSIHELDKIYMISIDLPLKNGEAQDSFFLERVSYKDSSELVKKFRYFSLKEGLVQSIKHNLPVYNCFNIPKEHIKIIEMYYVANGGNMELIS